MVNVFLQSRKRLNALGKCSGVNPVKGWTLALPLPGSGDWSKSLPSRDHTPAGSIAMDK